MADVAVGDGNALGRAGGAGSVDQIGVVIRRVSLGLGQCLSERLIE